MSRYKISNTTKVSPSQANRYIISNLSVFVKTTIVLILSFLLAVPTYATDEDQEALLDFNDKSGIYYYKKGGQICANIAVSNISLTSAGYDRLKEAVLAYGKFAMDMQRKYGVPWEVVFAQMQKESTTGTAGIAINGAQNNWLGIKGSGDAGTYTSNGVNWAVYSSIEASIEDWAGSRVLRNGYYDDAFPYLDPTNYNLEQFLKIMISHYAPNSDNNNESAYLRDILSFINGPISAARQQAGWPSSADLARTENIPIGGQHPLNSALPAASTNTISQNCITPNNYDINQTALSLSWPDRTHSNTEPKPEYYKALNAPNGVAVRNNGQGEGDVCSKRGDSCDAFVATVFRYSGVDPDFPCCTAVAQLNYLSKSSLYEEVTDGSLLPGDIRVNQNHIELYVVLDDGTGRIASASHCQRTADHYSPFYPDSSYQVFRKK